MTRSHAVSAVAGFVLALIVFVSMGQTAVDRTAYVRVQYMPHPRDMVQIQEGTPYAVPVGKIFVLTALGAFDPSGSPSLQVNGTQEVRAASEFNGGAVIGGNATSMKAIPAGFTAPAGAVLTVLNGVGKGRAWGYLADA